jgi:hypothetical protein
VKRSRLPVFAESLHDHLASAFIDANGNFRTMLPGEFTLGAFDDHLSSLDRHLDTVQDRHRLFSDA